MKEYLYLSIPWVILTAWNFYAGLYRPCRPGPGWPFSFSQEDNRLSNLIASLLAAPNQDRPFHAEAALLSCFQVILGFLFSLHQRGDGAGRFLSLLKAWGA